ncbi:putative mitochondrial protein [Tanacetum coccineum]
MNSNMARIRDELATTIQNAVSVALSGVSIETGRRNGEGTSKGVQLQFARMTKIEFPKFRGEDVRVWLYKCEQFFEIDHVSDPYKIQLASIHLYGAASLWHRQFVKLVGGNASWDSFKEVDLLRFGSAYDDPMDGIKNLRHTGTIKEYQNAFYKLISRIDLPEDQQINFYIAGLQSDVELVVRMYRPKSLDKVYHLSKIQEAAIKVKKQRYKRPMLPTPRFITNQQTQNPQNSNVVKQFPVPNTTLAAKRLNEPIFSRHYRHPPTQKDAIEVMVPNLQSHVNHLELVLQLLRAHTLCAKQSKCVFGAKRVEYLGYVITGAGVATDESKIVAIKEWPGYASISQPLTNLMKKNAFVWSEEIQYAFLNLKEAMVGALVLKLPNFDEPFMDYSPTQMKWLPKLMGFDYEIQYKKGSDNGVVDALSRVDTGEQLLQLVLSTISTYLFPKIVESWSTDPTLNTMIQNLKAGKPISKHYSWSHNQLRRKGKLVVGNDADLTMSLLTYFHCDSTGGDYGVAVTTQRIQSFCYWKKLKKHVRNFWLCVLFVKEAKLMSLLNPGLLQPHPIPTLIWLEISMDFVEGLSNSHIKTMIMVVVDRLSKYSHFMALSHPFTAIQVAQLFLDNIYKLHGLPKVIQSMEMDMWEIKEKLAERREQMAIRAYEEEKRRAELNQKIEEDKRREAWNQKIEKMINLIESFIQNPISSVKTPQRVTTKVPAVTTTVPAKPIQNSPCYDDLTFDRNKKITEKGVGKEGFGCALNKSKGSHLGLRHCDANRKRKKRKGPFVWTKSKSRVVIEVEQTEAIDGGLNCDNQLANYEQPCQHFLMFDYDPQEGELQVKT